MKQRKKITDPVWKRLPRPFFALAPMDDVTDTVFRRLVAGTARPDVMFTEFASVDGLCSAGRSRVMTKLTHTPEERPLIAHIWGTDPDHFRSVAAELPDMGFDGVDINMGCPVRKVVKSGCGAALIDNKNLAAEQIAAVKEGVAGRLPVSVKTRLGVKRIETEEWVRFLLEQDIDALTVHGRTAAEMSGVPAHWDEIAKAVRIRDRMGKETVIIGNGDVSSLSQGRQYVRTYGVDGVMVGRGVFHDMWLFDRSDPKHEGTPVERLELLRRHLTLFQDAWTGRKRYPMLKKYFKIYVQDFPGASELRTRLMETDDIAQAMNVIAREMV